MRMNSRTSLDNGRIGILRHDEFQQDRQSLVARQATVIVVIGLVCFVEGFKFANCFFHHPTSVIHR
jgi:hypothetical protein